MLRLKNTIEFMSLKKLAQKTDHLKTAIESIEVLIEEHGEEVLQPIKTYMKQQLEKANNEIDRLKSLNEIDTNF